MIHPTNLQVDHFNDFEPRVLGLRLTHRAMHFLKAPSQVALRAEVIVGITHRNHPEGLRKALKSAISQNTALALAFLVLDDSSDEDWLSSLDSNYLSDHRLIFAAGRFGSPAQARNGLLDLVDLYFPCARWVARLDADDCFATPNSLQALVHAGDTNHTQFVIGSNYLSVNGTILPIVNWANAEILQNRDRLNKFIQAFCKQETSTELPSCNLVIRTKSGIRYPNTSSAEDHWLLAGLLMHHPKNGHVVTEPPYAVYSLGGEATLSNQKSETWKKSRMALVQAAHVWHKIHSNPEATVLGWGQEGVVWKEPTGIYKHFYQNILSLADISRINNLTQSSNNAIIDFKIYHINNQELIIQLSSTPIHELSQYWPLELTRRFLQKLYQASVVTSNIKRENLRITPNGELQYIDIGRDIMPLTASRFLDCAARLYAIGELGWSDHELARRRTTERQAEIFVQIPGFEDFYGSLLRTLHSGCKLENFRAQPLGVLADHTDVTLLMKCCPQDANSLELQVRHI